MNKYFKIMIIQKFAIIIFLLTLSSQTQPSPGAFRKVQPVEIPEPVVPVYNNLKNLYLTTQFVLDFKPMIKIVTPNLYIGEGLAIQAAIKQITGVIIPVIEPDSVNPGIRLQENLILLGNRSTNKVISILYDQAYTFLDLKYPGPGGFVIRSLHNPQGNGRNVIFAGGSDLDGVKEATRSLIDLIRTADFKSGSLSVGYLCKIKLGKVYILPNEIKQAEIWEASQMYGSSGYFGWNMVSKNMALYYMTDEERYLKEFLRLAFPDKAAIKEIEDYDGERIENKIDPLSGPYHYSAHMMIELWDLIEESPALTNEQRLKITNAFARQLPHRVVEGVYRQSRPPRSLGDRHNDWSAFSLYVLGRYFEKDYHNPVWQRCLQAGDQYFSSLKNTYWMAGYNDHLFWFTSFYDPLLNYLILTGNRNPEMMKNLRQALNTQEILSTGLKNDWGIRASSISMLNKAAYILNDGRWLYYRERSGLDTEIFRLGQSFWPGPELKTIIPSDLKGKWNIQWMPEAMWKARETGFPQEQSFRWGSYRSEVGPGGDYILLDGYNGAGRNPYHTFDILELRINGATLLKGYHNQVITSADGMVEPLVPLDGILLYQDVIGQVAIAIAEVPKLPFVNWRRSLILRTGQFAIIADDLTFRTDSDNILAETTWEMPGAEWNTQFNFIKIKPEDISLSKNYELHPSEILEVKGGKITTMNWRGSARNGQHKIFFYLIGFNSTGREDALTCFRLKDNTAVLTTPDRAIVVAGQYQAINGEMVVLSEKNLYGHATRSAGLDQTLLTADVPVEIDWDFIGGKLSLVCRQPVKISLALSSPKTLIDGKKSSGKKNNGLYIFNLNNGRHVISNAKPSPILLAANTSQLSALIDRGGQARKEKPAIYEPTSMSSPPVLSHVMQADIGGSPVESIIIPSNNEDLLCTASGKTITFLNPDGKEVRKLSTSGDVRVLRWWQEYKLLLAGCADEQIIAFNEQGQKKWEFTSIMDQAVYEAGKQYWFKSAHPGIYGLSSGYFDSGKSRAFVGSACTLEILDENGQLVKRLPVFWGPGRQFIIVDAADGSKNLLVGRWHNDREAMAIINSNKMQEIGRGYFEVPPGHSYVNGWDCMNRYDNFLLDINGDNKRELVSAINGTWNRITIYSESGKALFNAQIGPGVTPPRANIRKMDVGDMNNDGKSEIIFGLSSGLVNALDSQAKKLWAKKLSSPPTVVRLVPEIGENSWICIGCEDSSVIAIDARGNIIKQGRVTGRPSDLQVIRTSKGYMAVITSDNGQVNGFRIE